MDAEARKAGIVGVFDRAAGSYDRVDVDFFGVFGRRLVQLAALAPGERVLDVGCGRGAVSFPAAEVVGPRGELIGVDLAPRMLELTAAEAKERGMANVSVRRGDAEWPDRDHEGYDAVLAAFVFFFLPDFAAVLRRYAGLLRSRGRLAISWFGDDDPRWSPVFEAAWAHVPPDKAVPDYRAGDSPWRSIAALESIIRDTGFAAVSTVEELHITRFPTTEHLWAWTRSHGMLYRWESMPEQRHAAARTDAETLLDAVREPDGILAMRTPVRYTIARCG